MKYELVIYTSPVFFSRDSENQSPFASPGQIQRDFERTIPRPLGSLDKLRSIVFIILYTA